MWLLHGNSLGKQLSSECEAFVRGHLAELVAKRGERVQVWAWTNLLAHGTEDELTAERSAARAQGAVAGWYDARSYLAVEVLVVAHELGSLCDVQQQVLVPMELEFASKPEVDWWGPGQWVDSVRQALDEARRVHRRAELRSRLSRVPGGPALPAGSRTLCPGARPSRV